MEEHKLKFRQISLDRLFWIWFESRISFSFTGLELNPCISNSRSVPAAAFISSSVSYDWIIKSKSMVFYLSSGIGEILYDLSKQRRRVKSKSYLFPHLLTCHWISNETWHGFFRRMLVLSMPMCVCNAENLFDIHEFGIEILLNITAVVLGSNPKRLSVSLMICMRV